MSIKLYFGREKLPYKSILYLAGKSSVTFTAEWGVTEKQSPTRRRDSLAQTQARELNLVFASSHRQQSEMKRRITCSYCLGFQRCFPNTIPNITQTGKSWNKHWAFTIPCSFLTSTSLRERDKPPLFQLPRTGGFLPVSISSILKRKALVSG